jgi:hypothetical protein
MNLLTLSLINMLHQTLILEDCVLVATRVTEAVIPQQIQRHYWDVTASDNLTGTLHIVELTDDEMAAINYLALSGDDSSPIALKMYETLDNVLAHWPNECRPVP